MKNYYDFVKNYFSADECTNDEKYCEVGHTFRFQTDEADGTYWFYQGENFTIDIHDAFIKKEIIHTSFAGLDDYYTFYSSQARCKSLPSPSDSLQPTEWHCPKS
mgnify:CR=1 FL=1